MTITESGSLSVLLAAAKNAGRPYPQRPFGYFCSYWPEELTLSVGWEPVRLLPPAGGAVPAGLPAFSCHPARACLAAAEGGAYRHLDGTGFTHGCDTMQCLSGIWPGETPFLFVPPNSVLAVGAQAYCAAELARLWQRLAEAAGRTPDDEKLHAAIVLMNRIRSRAAQLDEMRARLPSPLVAAVLRAGQLMPRAAYEETLAGAWNELASLAADEPARTGVLLAGSVLESDDLYTMVEELGARVVADDTCTGYRHFAGLVDENEEPLSALAARVIGRVPCPCRHRDLAARPEHLVALAVRRGARAAVLVVRKYCDPHAWDAVAVAERLRSAGVSVLVLEMETAVPGGAERTRLQALLEMVDFA